MADRTLFFLIFSHILHCCFANSTKIICESEQTIYLQHDKVYLIESPNFPHTMKQSCVINFVHGGDTENYDIYLLFTNAVISNATFTDSKKFCIPFINTNIYNMREISFDAVKVQYEIPVVESQYNAFQGMVLLKAKNTSCTLSFLKVSSPYIFHDESEIIVVKSNGILQPHKSKIHNCTWYFNAPFGYKFKIELESAFNHFSNTSSRVILSSDINVQIFNPTNTTSIVEIFGNSLSLSYLAFFRHFTSAVPFKISVVKIVPDTKNENCTVLKNGNTTIWTNIDENMGGYSNNARCSFILSVPWKNELLVLANITNYKSPDTINVYINNKKTYINFFKINYIPFYLQSKEDGFGREIIFEFVCDGNTQSQGFELTFIEKECNCGPPEIIVPCEGEHGYNIMFNDDDHYCGNLKCNFVISINPACPHKNVILNVHNIYEMPIKLEVYSDNNILFSNEWGFGEKVLLINGRKNILNFSTFSHSAMKFYLTAVNTVKILPKVILNETHPIKILNLKTMPNNSALTIELGDAIRNDLLNFFADSDYDSFTLYVDANLTKIYRIELTKDKYINVFLKTRRLTLYLRKNQKQEVLFRALNAHSKNCGLVSTVLWGFRRSTMFANAHGNCEMLLYNAGAIKQVWTSATTNPVTVSTAYDKPLFSFNKYDAFLWKDMALEAGFVKIVIPNNTSAIIDSSNVISNINLYFPVKTLWTSPEYGKFLFEPSFNQHAFATNLTFVFKVKDLDISEAGSLTLNDERVNRIEEIFEFTNTTVVLNFNETESGYGGFLIEIETKYSS